MASMYKQINTVLHCTHGFLGRPWVAPTARWQNSAFLKEKLTVINHREELDKHTLLGSNHLPYYTYSHTLCLTSSPPPQSSKRNKGSMYT